MRRVGPYLANARIDCPQFELRCPLRWGALKATKDPHQRHCDQCDRTVHLVYTNEALRARAKARDCVAVIRLDELPRPGDIPVSYLDDDIDMGLLEPIDDEY